MQIKTILKSNIDNPYTLEWHMNNRLCYIVALIFYSTVTLAGQPNHYLIKPTGTYSVGYQDVFLTNTTLCPDSFYHKNNNESDFSADNKNHCHELILRAYYPTQKPIQLSDKYDATYLNNVNNWWIKKYNLSKQVITQLNSLLNIKTYTTVNTKPITQKKFPIIIFLPGSGSPVQSYNNLISNLVSNGYIVIGINSLFINNSLQLSNGHIVKQPDSYLDVNGRNNNISDLNFVLNHLQKIAFKFNLAKSMNFKNIGLMGHSRGAMSIIHVIEKQNNSAIKAIILMDAGDMLGQKNYPLPKFTTPTLVIWSSSFKKMEQGFTSSGKNTTEMTLKNPNRNDEYSNHNNFNDYSTLQYHPGLSNLIIHDDLMVGKGNGFEITQVINNTILFFLNNNLPH